MNTPTTTFKIETQTRKLLGDMLTPVGVYLKLRDKFPYTVMLESAEYHGMEHGFSVIACDPVASFTLDQNRVVQVFPDGTQESFMLTRREQGIEALYNFTQRFEAPPSAHPFISGGLFGHITYDSVAYFEDIDIQPKSPESAIPQMVYRVYRFVVAFNHFKDEVYLFEHDYGTANEGKLGMDLDSLEMIVKAPKMATFKFKAAETEQSNFTDDQMRQTIQTCINHCLRGDVFQIVPSRRFSKKFEGDDFNVYRALRSVNPSPYLFFFDFGSYRVFGSSPEKQIFIKNGQAEIHPIAGTFRRTGDDAKDAELARQLAEDPKETAEHVMLVDLARNDLSRSCDVVKVETYKEAQFFSHVIHLVSKVTGRLNAGVNPLQLVADTFPAGTLSGAPKHNAMTIINRLEPTNRSIYGGALGHLSFNGDFNHCIAIRTFLSKDNTLFYQAGMGVVAKSNIDSEMQEVVHKLGALRKAIELANEI
ncbi:MAG: anthranilate synthase component I family protein [Cytophagia bacterium]|nr:MAG: anthranilate synthase component I family protein [Runella sp.]TAG17202.1 MAG: anthranilate synthase component I family protein [Cytophagales bacterium]TAG35785.1 MAG: anthranilate synthase component I family protein [Cytophagia bacterium]TAG77560.1 MAG: anthranilate synthase component I family protein [Cytophagales bacterium]